MTDLKLGTGLPSLRDARAGGAPGLAEAARHVEELGFDAVFEPDLIIGDGTPGQDATVTLAAVAAVTRRVRLGFGVLTLPLRPVAWTAAQVQTLQHLSGNRVLLGVGSGGFPGTPFWQAVGAPPARERGRVTNAALEAIPTLIEGKPTRVAEPGGPDQPPVTLAPPAPAPPILVGGNSVTAMRRAVLHGDGWFPSLVSPERLAAGAARLRELAAEHGRATPSITVGGHAFLGDDEETRAARAAFVRSLVTDHYTPPEEAERAAMTGRSPAEFAERLAAYAEAGADRVVTGPDTGDWARGCEFIAEARVLLG